MALENYARSSVEDTLQDVALQVGLIGYRSAVACQDLLKGVNHPVPGPLVYWQEQKWFDVVSLLKRDTYGQYIQFKMVLVPCISEKLGKADWLCWSDEGDNLICKRLRLLYTQ